MKTTVFVLTCLCSTSLFAQFSFSGVLHQSEADLRYTDAQSWDSLQIVEKQMIEEGYRLLDLESAEIDANRQFWAIWIKSSLGHAMKRVDSWPEFIKEKRAMVDEGYVMEEVEGMAITDTEQQFIGSWRKGDTPHKVWRLDSREGIRKKTKEMAEQEFFLQDLDVFQTPSGGVQYLALYHQGPIDLKAFIVVEKDLKVFNTELLQRTKSGYRIIDYERYTEAEEVFYLAVMRKGDYEAVLLRGLDQDGFYGRLDMSEQNRFQLVDIELDILKSKPKLTVKK